MKKTSPATVMVGGAALITPAKHTLVVPTQALAEAIASEWAEQKKFAPSKMPLTALAYTAVDRIENQKENIAEALLAYVDTDTLSYRSTGSQKLAQRQTNEWDPVVSWMSKKFGAIWQITTGITSLEQPAAMHDGIRSYLLQKTAFELAAISILSSLFSSVVLALAVAEKELDAKRAFMLSRLEEESQAEQWGRDEEADARASKMQEEIVAAAHFLRLLEA